MKPKWAIRPVTNGDVFYLADRLRKTDMEELKAYTGKDNCLHAVMGSWVGSIDSFTVLKDDKPVGMFGLCERNQAGSPWLLGTDELTENPFFLTLNARRYINEWLEHYGVLFNYVDARNKVAIRWLKALGFTVKTKVTFTNPELPFFEFTKTLKEGI